jgi:hypothetical protein
MTSSMPSASKPPDYEYNENKISVTLWISNERGVENFLER